MERSWLPTVEVREMVQTMLRFHIRELRFEAGPGRGVIRTGDSGSRPYGTGTGTESNGSGVSISGSIDAAPLWPSEGVPPTTRLVLLRSPEVGTWFPSVPAGADTPLLEAGTVLGHVLTLTGDEPLRAPARGRVREWLVGEGRAVGMEEPVGFWEVR